MPRATTRSKPASRPRSFVLRPQATTLQARGWLLECPHRVLDLTHPQRSRRQQSKRYLGRHSQLAADPFSCRPRLRPAEAGCAQRADGAHGHAVAPAVDDGRLGDREVLVKTGMAPGAVGRGVGEETQRRDTESPIGPQRAQGPARQRVGRHHRVHVPRRGKGAGLGGPAQALGEPARRPVRVLEVSEDLVEERWGVAHRRCVQLAEQLPPPRGDQRGPVQHLCGHPTSSEAAHQFSRRTVVTDADRSAEHQHAGARCEMGDSCHRGEDAPWSWGHGHSPLHRAREGRR